MFFVAVLGVGRIGQASLASELLGWLEDGTLLVANPDFYRRGLRGAVTGPAWTAVLGTSAVPASHT